MTWVPCGNRYGTRQLIPTRKLVLIDKGLHDIASIWGHSHMIVGTLSVS